MTPLPLKQRFLANLRAFEACGRHGSFTRAAEELFITPGAVSQQIKQLETELRARLFVRTNRNVELTPQGRAYWETVHNAFAAIGSETSRLFEAAGKPLRILCARSYLRLWLMPRLPEFQRLHPDIKVDFSTFDSSEGVELVDFDAAIRLGQPPWAGYRADLVSRIRLFPVASPDYLERHETLRSPGDLARHTLIHAVNRPDDWAIWLAAAGAEGVRPAGETRMEGESLEYQAAISGLGIALARDIFCEQELASGRLLRLFDTEIELANAYHLIYWPALRDDARLIAFRSWLMAAARQRIAA